MAPLTIAVCIRQSLSPNVPLPHLFSLGRPEVCFSANLFLSWMFICIILLFYPF